MAVLNPNNWHWVDKNCIDWARQYFQNELTKLKIGGQDEEYFCEISKVSQVDGDCEVNQRKGKVISLFDLKIVTMIRGHVSGKLPFEGSITIPEVAFDSEVEDYQFMLSIYKENKELSEVKPLIREKLIPQLRQAFQRFGKDLLTEHGNDIQIPEQEVQSQYTKGNQHESFANANASAKRESRARDVKSDHTTCRTTNSTTTTTNVGNRTTLHVEPRFNASGDDLFLALTEKPRIMAWSRGSADFSKCSSGGIIVEGDQFGLFGGNVLCQVKKLDSTKRILEMEWKLSDWNFDGSMLSVELHESPEHHETTLQANWKGVPVGQEERVLDNFENYYVRALKITFGFGAVL
ncbi:hypothetical protein TBLA_0H00670 [Henningerozyma blattae CBS 6284]|uniref:Activator of Hsp90 ATPase AHSA1-like N-terminal domain-containing protein n=1 Tax=Henningerozyma blattae (strain ATCC 34711 / CBS 6284 / DSM 70876 / NBRC 10599 / NRRL Y-10934 / UCD 77-7) TaxID=1071380 RepID=I2H7K6_HENB6|nr:hypothetical protein TBLA_0H00670 [Tetrapisispora blattae CBS 6284]CCH62358.1 hypothetical protein TBLA_0H00670 [Tetrapisispora blattae CBS 6284]